MTTTKRRLRVTGLWLLVACGCVGAAWRVTRGDFVIAAIDAAFAAMFVSWVIKMRRKPAK